MKNSRKMSKFRLFLSSHENGKKNIKGALNESDFRRNKLKRNLFSFFLSLTKLNTRNFNFIALLPDVGIIKGFHLHLTPPTACFIKRHGEKANARQRDKRSLRNVIKTNKILRKTPSYSLERR